MAIPAGVPALERFQQGFATQKVKIPVILQVLERLSVYK